MPPAALSLVRSLKAATLLFAACLFSAQVRAQNTTSASQSCAKPLYLTFDTGHMGVAPLVAEVLKKYQVKATFFVAAEKTLTNGHSLDDTWAPWWRERVAEGHAFASHTLRHSFWKGDLPQGQFAVKPQFGAVADGAGQLQTWTARQYCQEVAASAQRFKSITGHHLLPLFRAPGGKHSPALLAAAKQCPYAGVGWAHVGWSAAGFLGDELPSDRYPNAVLLKNALRDLKGGEILLAHLGIWSRKDPWAPAVLEPLISGLKVKGFCFATLDQHPSYQNHVRAAKHSI